MRVLITGGFGYLGARVAKYLAEQSYDVVLGSRTKQIAPDWLPEATVIQLHWEDEHLLRNVCSNIDAVIHTAGMNAQDCSSDPVAALAFNGVATARLVRASKDVGVFKFIYLSTAHVYASPLVGTITEATYPLNKHPYATSHLAGEKALMHASENNHGFTGVVLRLSNGVGAPVHKTANCWMLVVNDLCRQVVKNKKIIINSPRKIERDYFPISMLEKTIASILTQDEIENSIINVSSSKTTTLEEVANMICECSDSVLGYRPEVLYHSNDVTNNVSNLSISNNYLKRYTTIESRISDEISGLLLKCEKWFPRFI